MQAPAISPPSSAPFEPDAIRRRTLGLLLLGATQLLIFLGSAVKDFYWGDRIILLQAQPQAAAFANRPHSTTFLASPVGDFIGTRGDLLYHATSLGDYLQFYTIGSINLLNALFILAVGIYLHLALGRLTAGRRFSGSVSQALSVVGLLATLMYVLEMVFNQYLFEAFQTKTHHLFFLVGRNGSNELYVAFGLVMLVCAGIFRRGTESQPGSKLTD